jgi:hypothetical protein
MNETYHYSRRINCTPPPPPKPSKTDKIGKLLRQLDGELQDFVPENANTTFVMAIHTCRLAVKGLKKFF